MCWGELLPRIAILITCNQISKMHLQFVSQWYHSALVTDATTKYMEIGYFMPFCQWQLWQETFYVFCLSTHPSRLVSSNLAHISTQPKTLYTNYANISQRFITSSHHYITKGDVTKWWHVIYEGQRSALLLHHNVLSKHLCGHYSTS